MRRETSPAEAPGVVVEGTDARFRSLTVGKAILAARRRRLDEQDQKHWPERASRIRFAQLAPPARCVIA